MGDAEGPRGQGAPWVRAMDSCANAEGTTHQMSSSQRGGSSLIERKAELAVLKRQMTAAATGEGSVVHINAPAGTGKTRLIREAARLAQSTGLLVLEGRGREVEREFPFGVVTELFEHHPAAISAASLENPGTREDDTLFQAIHRLFTFTRDLATEGGEPLGLLVDDADRADAPSLRFLAYLAARISGLPIALVVALRPGRPLTDPQAGQALREAAGDIVLHPDDLTTRGTGMLVRRTLPDAPPGLATRCHHVTGGNPFLLVSLLDLLQSGDHQTESPSGPDVIEELSPDPVRAAIGNIIDDAGADALEVARAVAVLGQDASLQRVARAAGLDRGAASRSAERLADAGLLSPGESLAFRYPMAAQAVLSELAPWQRAELAERASIHASDPSVPGPRERIALAHLALARGLSGAHRTLVRSLAELAWGDGTPVEAGPEHAPELLVSRALMVVDELETGIAILGEFRLDAPDGPARAVQLSAVGCRSWTLFHQGRVADAVAQAEAAVAAGAPVAAGDGVSLAAVIAACRIARGRLDRAETALLGLDDPDGLPAPDIPLLLETRARLRLEQDRPGLALADALAAGRLQDDGAGGTQSGAVEWRSTAALAHTALGDIEGARRLAEEELDLARARDVPRAVVRNLRVLALTMKGKDRLELLEQSVAAGEDRPIRLEYLTSLVALGVASRRGNRTTLARRTLTHAQELCAPLGLTALEERAQRELEMLDGRSRQATGIASLTPSERRVAELAASGYTTRQIAETLVVTRKTVEFHLRHVYRKLDVPSNRTDLARAMGHPGPSGRPPAPRDRISLRDATGWTQDS
jgi:DNA-binding NarL/FixJ family response regulator